MLGTDPVAMDHELIELIEEKREAEGAVSIFERSKKHLGNNRDPNFKRYMSLRRMFAIRERLKLEIVANATDVLNHTELRGNFSSGFGSTILTNNPSGDLVSGYSNSSSYEACHQPAPINLPFPATLAQPTLASRTN